MKLKDCRIGILVRLENGEIGHIVGLTYNVAVRFTGNMSFEELRDVTIPLVRFPDGDERGVHHHNLSVL